MIIMKLSRNKKQNITDVKTDKRNVNLRRIFDGNVSLNQTVDFAGGCSQYKTVVQQVQGRRADKNSSSSARVATRSSSSHDGIQEKPASETAKSLTDNNHRPEMWEKSASESQTGPNSRPEMWQKSASESQSGNKNIWVKSESGTAESQTETGEDSGEAAPCEAQGPSTNDSEGISLAFLKKLKCPLCDQTVPTSQLQAHRRMCLQEKFKHSKLKDDKEEADFSTATDQTIKCVVCQKDISNLDLDARSAHVIVCMDKRSPSSTDGENMENIITTDVSECPICQKQLGHLSEDFRLKHTSRCYDKQKQEEEANKAEEAKRAREKRKVLDCPVCGQKLKSQANRTSHLKKCRELYNIPHHMMVEKVREQEDQYRLLLQATDGPAKPPPRSRRGRGRGKSAQGSRTSRERITNPVEAEQIALALSKSLYEEEQRRSISQAIIPASEPAPSTSHALVHSKDTDAFSVLMSPKKDVQPVKKRGRQKDRDGTLPQLLTTSRDEAAKKIADKMAAVILPAEDGGDITGTPKMPDTDLADKYTAFLPNKQKDESGASLWQSSSLTTPGDGDSYYVKSLMPPISQCTVKAGSKLKSMASIPGRGPDDSIFIPDAAASSQSNTVVKVRDLTLNETLVPSTQTAVMLAELVGDTGDVTMHHVAAEAGAAEASGFLMPAMVEETPTASASDATLSVYECMVNNKLASDLQIRVRGGEHIHAHKFVFAARCQELYQSVMNESEIDLEEFSDSSVISVMTYLYCGKLQVSKSHMSEVRALGQRWRLPELRGLLDKRRLDDGEADGPANVSLDEADKTQDKELHEILKQVWGNEDEDDDDDDDDDDVGDEDDNNDDSDGDNDRDNDNYKDENNDEGSDNDAQTEDINDAAMMPVILNKSISMSPVRKLSQMSDQQILEMLSTSTADHSMNVLLQDSEDDQQADVFLNNNSDEGMDTSSGTERLQSSMDISDGDLMNADEVGVTDTHLDSSTHQDAEEVGCTDTHLDSSTHQDAEEVGITDTQLKSSTHQVAFSAHSNHHSFAAKNKDNSDNLNTDLELSGNESDVRELESAFIHEEECTDSFGNHKLEQDSGIKDMSEMHTIITTTKQSEEETLPKAVDTKTPVSKVMKRQEDATPDLFDDGDEATDESVIDLSKHSETPVSRNQVQACPKFDSKEQSPARRVSTDLLLFESDDDSSDNNEPNKSADSASDTEGCPNRLFYKKLDDTLSKSPVFHGSQKHSNKEKVFNAKVNLSSKFNGEPELGLGEGVLHMESSVQMTSTETCEITLLDKEYMCSDMSPASVSQKRKRGSSQEESSVTLTPKRQKESSDMPDRLQVYSDSPVFKSRIACTCKSPSPMKTSRRPVNTEKEMSIDLTQSEDEASPASQRNKDGGLDPGTMELAAETDELGQDKADTYQDDTTNSVVEDVWEDFDDDGGFVFMEAVSAIEKDMSLKKCSQRQKVGSSQHTKTPSKLTQKQTKSLQTPRPNEKAIRRSTRLSQTPGNSKSSPSKAVVSPQPYELDYDPPTDVETDVSVVLAEPDLWCEQNAPVPVNNYKTPQSRNVARRGRKKAPIPSPFTPMPNYDAVSTPHLKEACKKFGIKPHAKKKMIKSLKHIYHETHQYETDSDLEVSIAEDSTAEHLPGHTDSTVDHLQGNLVLRAECLRNADATGQGQGSQGSSQSSQGDGSASSDSDEDDNEAMLQETMLDAGSSSQSGSERGSPVKGRGRGRGRGAKRGSASAQPRKRIPKLQPDELREKLKEYIQTNDDLHLQILYYKPLKFDAFCAELKANGLHAKDDVIGQCLDELNITYTTKSDDGQSKWGKKHRKKKSPKKKS